MTSLPEASTISAPSPERSVPTATIFSSSASTSAAKLPSAVTTVPPVKSSLPIAPPFPRDYPPPGRFSYGYSPNGHPPRRTLLQCVQYSLPGQLMSLIEPSEIVLISYPSYSSRDIWNPERTP